MVTFQLVIRRRLAPLFGLALSAVLVSGCATAVVGSVTLGEISAAAGLASVSATGKGLQDHALSAVTGQDCRVLEGIVRANRRICEEPGSAPTESDFKGVVPLLARPGEPDRPPAAAPPVRYAGLESSYRPTLARAERRRPGGADRAPAPEILVELPRLHDWARQRPAPVMTTAWFEND